MKNILAKLFPSDRKYKSTVQIVSIDAGGKLNIEKVCHPADLPEKMNHFIFDSEKNYYIMANSTYPYQRRITENLFALNNLVIDLDIHDDNVEPYDRYRYIEEFAWRLKRDIVNSDDPAFPAPHVIHYTGRGLQLWWHIAETSAQLLFVYREVMDLLLIALEEYLDECRACVGSLHVDVSTQNPLGIFRLFETINIKTGQKTEYEYFDIPAYTLDALKESLLGNEAVATYLQKEKRKKEKAVREKRMNSENASEKSVDSQYTSLLQKRLWIIRKLASEMTQHEGVRNKYLMLAYSTARKIYSAEEAKTFCRELNNLFVPKMDRIEYIFRTKKHTSGTKKISVRNWGLVWITIRNCLLSTMRTIVMGYGTANERIVRLLVRSKKRRRLAFFWRIIQLRQSQLKRGCQLPWSPGCPHH